MDELGCRGPYDEGREQEISRLETWLSDHNRLHREDLLLLEGGGKPNGDQSKGRHDSIANWFYACPPQSICLRMNVGISISERSCSGDDRSFSGVTGGLTVGGGRRGAPPQDARHTAVTR